MIKKKNCHLLIFYFIILVIITGISASFILWKILVQNKFPCANSISCTRDLSGKPDPTKTIGEFLGKPVIVPKNLLQKDKPTSVLGITNDSDKRIYIDLTNQRLFAYQGNKPIFNFPISSGLWNPTPVGKFYIWTKLLATNMEGGDKKTNTYYNLPNVPYTMYFYNENVGKWYGYGIHGAYWQVRFGRPMTFGCIALTVEDAEKLYYWTDKETPDIPFITHNNKGTLVYIYGKATQL